VALAVGSVAFAADPAEVLKTLRVPEGFTVELVATTPLVEHPVMAGFDDRGRLFVADNAGLNLPAEELLKQLPNSIRALEDTDGDGVYEKSTVFADRMTFPQGAAWYRGSLYVASPPSIWRLTDTDGDGQADRREELVQKFGFIGNAADIHGCFITPTGRVAWCDGRHGHEFKDAGGSLTSKGLAARVFSCRTDGSDVEVFCGGGMDNPVEVAFTGEGDTIGTMTFYNPDAARHDALVHFVYGGVYPKKHPCTSEFQRTGELMPALTRFGVTAPSGVTRYPGAVWGEEYRDNLFSVHFNTHKVLRHVLTRDGATLKCLDEEFLTSDHADFHPTDVLADADGSLLVVDTGGWFRIGCPTSQIAKPEIGGAIYRIRRTNSTPVVDPRGLKIDWERTSDTEMADLLGDPRPAVAERAIEILAERGDAAMGSLATALFELTDYRARQNAVWALARNGSDNAKMLLRQVLSDDEATVRQAAAYAAGELRDVESLPVFIDLLRDADPAVRRVAATGLGRLKNASAVSPLLAALAEPTDRFLEHALIFALIEINDPAATAAGLAHASAKTQRGALIALDQMSADALSGEQVTGLLKTDDPALLRTLVEVLTSHPDWSSHVLEVVRPWLAATAPSEEQLAMARGAVAALVDHPEMKKQVAATLSAQVSATTQRMLLEVLAAGEFDGKSPELITALGLSLQSSDADVVRQAIATSAAVDANALSGKLLAIATDTGRPAELRIAAWRAASAARPKLDQPGFEFLVKPLQNDDAMRERLAAAEALGGCDLGDEQLLRLAPWLAKCGPLEIGALMRAYDRAAGERVGLALVAALAKSPAAETLSVARLNEVLSHYPTKVQQAADKLLARSQANDAQRAQQVQSLEALAANGNPAAGEDLFFSQRAACSGCHRVGARGEKIGPDLSKIGEVRKGRDLAEAILFPSVSLARGFESLHVVTKDGRVQTGLLSRETTGAIYLRTTDRAEIRLDRDEVEQLTPSPVSIMPQGLDKTLTAREMSDVVAYLLTLK